MSPTAGKAVLAFNDTFGDDESHRWDWQLRPEAGVSITIAADKQSFTFRQGTAVMTGVIIGTGHTVEVIDGTLRISRTGKEATFKVLLAVGTSDVETLDGAKVKVGNTTYDLDQLAGFSPRR